MQRCSVSVPIHAHHSMGLWPSFTHIGCSVVSQSRSVHGKISLIVVDGPSLGAVFIQVVCMSRYIQGMKTALWVRRDVLSVVSMLQRTYRLINQSCHPVCWSFQLCMEYMTHTSHSMFHVGAPHSSSSESRRRRIEATLWSVNGDQRFVSL